MSTLNTFSRVRSFEHVGWTDPQSPSAAKLIKSIQQLNFDTPLYESHLITPEAPPPCIFMPEPEMLKSMVKLAIKYSYEGRRIMLAKFYDLELEPHPYMIN